ncbi:MAG: CCA tRNA nucleotidyltransferase [Candidatus Micrarchaeia archaeon]
MKQTARAPKPDSASAARFEAVASKVAAIVSPTAAEAAAEKAFADGVVQKLSRLLPQAKVTFIGSAARDTGLRGSRDIDIFAAFQKGPEERIVARTFAAARACIRGAKWEKHYAEHPYLQAKVAGFEIEVIPCFAIKENQKIISAVDRSPLHMAYLERKLTLAQRRDVRVLKQLLKSAGIYGAEARIGGFSGYVCELLVLNYRGLYELLQAASNWRLPVVIDIEGQYYQDDKAALARFPASQLVVVDVTDKERNAAAAISPDSLASFITLARTAGAKPSSELFFHKEKIPADSAIASGLSRRGTHAVLAKAKAPAIVDDIFYPQLAKTRDSMAAYLKRRGLMLVDSAHFSDGKFTYLLFEFAHPAASPIEVCNGPPAFDAQAVAGFVSSRGKGAIRGPFIREGRLVVEVARKLPAELAVAEYLRSCKSLGAASHFQGPLKKAAVLAGPRKIVAAVSAKAKPELAGFVFRKSHWL